MTLTLRLKIAQKPYTVWSLGPKALKYESLEPKGYRASGFKVQSRLLGDLGFRDELFSCTWVVVKIMVPFWVPIIIRHLLFRVPKIWGHNFDNYPHRFERLPVLSPKPHSNIR